MVYIIRNLLVLHFGENCMKIRTEIAKLQIHENLHKNVNENLVFFYIFIQIFFTFYEEQLKQLISYIHGF